MAARLSTSGRPAPARRESVWRAVSPGQVATALERLGPGLAVVHGSERTERLSFHDTYDWDLAFAGLTILRHGNTLFLCPAGRWHARHALARQALAPGGGASGSRIAPGPVIEALARRVGPRRLLPVGDVRRHVAPCELRDTAGRALARIRLEEYRQSGAHRKVLLVLVVVTPWRRPGRERAAVRAALAAAGLEPVSGSCLRALPSFLLPVPPRDAIRPRSAADRQAPAGPAVAALALALLEAMRRQEQGILQDTDPECLHQYRVHLRKLRVLLRETRKALPEEAAADLREALGMLARRTNRLRDLDVMIQAESGYRKMVPEPLHETLTAAFVAIRRRRGLERGRLVRLLRSAGYADLHRRAREALAAAGQASDGKPASPVGRLVRRRVRKLYRGLVRGAAAMPPDASASEYHRLRVQCKRLRYLLDLFREVFSKGPALALAERLRELQETLGARNDLAVQREHLEALLAGADKAADPDAQPAVVLAGLWRRLARRRQALDRRVQARLARLHSRRTARLVRGL